MLKREQGGWNDPLARATRGLRRMGKERPGALLARRTRTVKLCTFCAQLRAVLATPLELFEHPDKQFIYPLVADNTHLQTDRHVGTSRSPSTPHAHRSA